MSKDITKKMLSKIRECNKINSKFPPLEPSVVKEKGNMITEFKDIAKKALLKEDENPSNNSKSGNEYAIEKNNPQFGDIRTSQEESLIKTIGENIELEDNALVYNPSEKTLVFSGKITSINLIFQFKYNDPSGEGCYIWVNGLQLTESNQRILGKIRDGFLNWKSSLIQNSDLLKNIQKAANEKE